jgi:catechol 2,3-dioxygenase-like lactoylglutathione lyase family enzyme
MADSRFLTMIEELGSPPLGRSRSIRGQKPGTGAAKSASPAVRVMIVAAKAAPLPRDRHFRSQRPVYSRHIAAEERDVFTHITIGSNDIGRSRQFYDALIGAMGGPAGVEDKKGRLIYAHRGGRLMITKPIDGKAATHANGGTIGFATDSPEQTDAWHDAGVANGGISIEDPPGVRQGSSGPIYLAYLRDPDGNKLCALHRMAG